MAETGGGKKKKGKPKSQGKKTAVSLNEFLADGGGSPAVQRMSSWADQTEDIDSKDISLTYISDSKLPSAPRAATEPSVDYARLPKNPPFIAFLGNLSYDATEDDIKKFFEKNRKISPDNVRLVRDRDGRLKGFGYAEFTSVKDLVEALKLNKMALKYRPLQIDIADGKGGDNEGGRKQYREDDKTPGDWRSSRDPSPPSRGYRDGGRGYGSRGYGDSGRGYDDRRGYGSRGYRDRPSDGYRSYPRSDRSPPGHYRNDRSPPTRSRYSPPRRRSPDRFSPPRRRSPDRFSPRRRSPDRSPPPRRRSPERFSPRRRSPDRSPPPRRRSPDRFSPHRRSPDRSPPPHKSPDRFSPPHRRSPDQSPPPRRPSDRSSPPRRYSPYKRSPSPRRYSPDTRSPQRLSPRAQRLSQSPPRRSSPDRTLSSPRRHTPQSPRRHSPSPPRDRPPSPHENNDYPDGQLQRDERYRRDEPPHDRAYDRGKPPYDRDRGRPYDRERDRPYDRGPDRYDRDDYRSYGGDRDRKGWGRDDRFNGDDRVHRGGYDRGGRRDQGGYGRDYGRRGGRGGYGRDQYSDRSRDDYRGGRQRDQYSPEAREDPTPKERPKLKLQPRSRPSDSAGDSSTTGTIFGGAKPVDTAKKDREIEERLMKKDEEVKPTTPTEVAKPSVYGDARPVDTSKRDRQVEEKITILQRRESREDKPPQDEGRYRPRDEGTRVRKGSYEEKPRRDDTGPWKNREEGPPRRGRGKRGDGRTRDGEDRREERPSREDRPGRGRGKGRGGAKQDRPQPSREPKKLEEETPDFQQPNRFATLMNDDSPDGGLSN